MNYLISQFAHPRGPIGRLVGMMMAYENRERNAWAVSLLKVQEPRIDERADATARIAWMPRKQPRMRPHRSRRGARWKATNINERGWWKLQ